MVNLAGKYVSGRARRVTLDLRKLLLENKITEEDASRLEEMAEPVGQRRVVANLFLVFGAIMVVVGVLAFEPPLDVGLALALAGILGGGLLVFRANDEWGLLGQALALMGILGLSGWAALRFDGLDAPWPALTWPFIFVMTLAGALVFRNAVMAALAPMALASCLGGGTGYWHAAYAIFMSEPTISIVVFGIIASALFFTRSRLPDAYQPIAVVMARVSFFLGNFGFWIGSLWGDYPGEIWQFGPDDWSGREAWRQTALFIPDTVFSVGWAVALIAAILVGVRAGRRFLANTAIVFLAIHFYTQIFETLSDVPISLVLGGILLIALGIGVVRFDRWLLAQANENSAAG